MKQIPCFKGWTHNSMLKFSYYLEKQKMIRNQKLYEQGKPAHKIFIVKKGEVELIRKMKRQASETNKGRLNERVFGARKFKIEEWEKSRSPELKRALDVLPQRASYAGKS